MEKINKFLVINSKGDTFVINDYDLKKDEAYTQLGVMSSYKKHETKDELLARVDEFLDSFSFETIEQKIDKENFDYEKRLNELKNMLKKDVDDVEYAIILALVERTNENDFTDAISENTVQELISNLDNEYNHGFEALDETLQSRADNMVDNYIEEALEKRNKEPEQDQDLEKE